MEHSNDEHCVIMLVVIQSREDCTFRFLPIDVSSSFGNSKIAEKKRQKNKFGHYPLHSMQTFDLKTYLEAPKH